LDASTKFIPLWVKIAVAIALGLGTMIGWKRIVVTVGEKIGKTHLTYAQGASAELVAMSTIAAADVFGLPVSTTHVLSSGIAGTMAANRSGLQGSTVRNLLMAWVLTLPAAILLSGGLYFLFRSGQSRMSLVATTIVAPLGLSPFRTNRP
jgi:inorganic phosphate transporter, PiT family